MKTFKIDPKIQGAVPWDANVRHCENCAFAVPTHMQGQIMSVLTCRRAPPAVIAVMDPQGRGFQPITIFPIVTGALHCFEHVYPNEVPMISEPTAAENTTTKNPSEFLAQRVYPDGPPSSVRHTDIPSAYPAVSDEKADDNLIK